jgi:hypothetical protein
VQTTSETDSDRGDSLRGQVKVIVARHSEVVQPSVFGQITPKEPCHLLPKITRAGAPGALPQEMTDSLRQRGDRPVSRAYPAPTFSRAAEAFVTAHAARADGTAVKYRQTLRAISGVGRRSRGSGADGDIGSLFARLFPWEHDGNARAVHE